jgi:hypothetical protein
MTAQGTVEIRQDGPGGTILYLQNGVELRFSWEFAMPPSIALVFGPLAWKEFASAAAEVKTAIFHRVAAEVVRQRAPGGSYEIDWDRGILDIRRSR